ncbi:MAG: SRPBCC domain-containing protein [Verrucomicrobiota bacterium]
MKLALIFTFSLLGLFSTPQMSLAESPVFSEEIEIVAPLESVWHALITPAIVAKYHLAPLLKIELEEGGKIVFGTEEAVMISGRITEITPSESLAHTFVFGTQHHSRTETDGEKLVTYQLERLSSSTMLMVTHSGFESENQTYANITGGWPHILASMKQTLEADQDATGQPASPQ